MLIFVTLMEFTLWVRALRASSSTEEFRLNIADVAELHQRFALGVAFLTLMAKRKTYSDHILIKERYSLEFTPTFLALRCRC